MSYLPHRVVVRIKQPNTLDNYFLALWKGKNNSGGRATKVRDRIVSGYVMTCIKPSAIIASERLDIKNNTRKMHHLEMHQVLQISSTLSHFDRSEMSGLKAAEAQVMKVNL